MPVKNNELSSIDFSSFWITYLNDTIDFPTIGDLSEGSYQSVISNEDQSTNYPRS